MEDWSEFENWETEIPKRFRSEESAEGGFHSSNAGSEAAGATGGARHFAFFPDGARTYVTRENDGMISLVDTIKYQPIQTVDIGPQGEVKPISAIPSCDAKTAYASSRSGRCVFVIDTSTNKVTASFEVEARPLGLALSPDEKVLCTANGPSNDVSAVDLSSQKLIKKIRAGASP